MCVYQNITIYIYTLRVNGLHTMAMRDVCRVLWKIKLQTQQKYISCKRFCDNNYSEILIKFSSRRNLISNFIIWCFAYFHIAINPKDIDHFFSSPIHFRFLTELFESRRLLCNYCTIFSYRLSFLSFILCSKFCNNILFFYQIAKL